VEISRANDIEIIECSNCSRELLIIKKQPEKGEKLFSLRVECPFCMDHSYDKPVYEILRHLAVDGVRIKEFVELPNNVQLFKTIKG
jgi:hypothetical protein